MTIKPGTIIGYRKNGLPIRLLAGGSESVPEPVATPPVPAPPGGIPLQQGQTFSYDQLQQRIAEVEGKYNQQLSGLTTQFTSAQEQLAALQKEREERDAAARAEADRLAEEQRKADEEKLSLKDLMAKRDRENEERFAHLNQELARRDALLQKEREFAELERYKTQRLLEAQEPDPQNGHSGIHPQLRDLVGGSTREAIDASINSMLARTAAMLEEMQQLQIQQHAAMPGVSPTAGNIGVMDQQDQTRTYSPEDIANMAPGSEAHMRLRAQYGMGGAANRGMFG